MKDESVLNPFLGKEIALAYHKFRPHLHEVPFRLLHDHHGANFCKALDVACGTGRSTHSLSLVCDNIIGIDYSQDMIDQAKENYPELNFELMNAEHLAFAEDSFDLINISMGIHWLDHTKFITGIRNVLKPKGLLSIDNYGFRGIVSGDESVQKVHNDFFNEFLPNVTKYDSYLEEDFLTEYQISFVEEITYQRHISMGKDSFTGFLKTMSNYLALSHERKKVVSKKMDEIYGAIFDDKELPLEFGGRLKIFERLT